MMETKINIFILPQKSVLPRINYSENDMEKDSAYQRVLRAIEKKSQEAYGRKQKKCDISVDVETHKIPALKKLLEKKGYNVFVQGVYV